MRINERKLDLNLSSLFAVVLVASGSAGKELNYKPVLSLPFDKSGYTVCANRLLIPRSTNLEPH